MRHPATWLVAGAMLIGAAAWAADGGDGVLGTWRTAEDKSQVEVFKKDNRYCAKIVSLKEPNWPADDEEGMAGKPKNDRRNPDAKLRSRQIVGIEFMTGFSFAGKNRWEGGRIYDPESGKTYRCTMSVNKSGQLEVHGYVGISLFGRTEVWSRKGDGK